MTQEQYMRLTLKLARKAVGKTSPNPMVGALVVKNGTIIGAGYHKRFGQPHAEANALKACGEKAKDATLYVNLEPCCHQGKTPPCTDLIIKNGIREVVCATIDPNPRVNGRGVRILRRGGVRVDLGILEADAKKLNESYLKFATTGLPFVILKVAQTLDGRIATKTGHSRWITQEDSRRFVHLLRSSVDAVLVGANTVIRDDPELTIHEARGKNPMRIILDSTGQIPRGAKVVGQNQNGKTIIATTNRRTREKLGEKVKTWKVGKSKEGMVDLRELMRKAGENQISRLLVEGGGEVFTAFLKEKLVDKIYYFLSPKILGKAVDSFGDLGIKEVSDSITLRDCELKKFKDDLLVIGYPVWRI